NSILKNTTPIAEAYAGHQFGYFTMLGDGRAVLLGEFISKNGERLDIQLKGSGRTPYSRGGDGKASLGPMLREYIISEAMYHLGIKTTRSLAVVKTGEEVFREKALPGAVLTRIAKSHIRVGTFEYIAHFGDKKDLKALADYTLNRHFHYDESKGNKYLYLLREVINKQAKLIAKWMHVGFIHGVMNTDNMVISGETIDYGPCAFMDTYSPKTVFSSIDRKGRYAYGNQPKIAAWNLTRFAETLVPLIDDNAEESIKLAEKELAKFNELFEKYYYDGMRKKLGLYESEANDIRLIDKLLAVMEKYKADYTNTFKALTEYNIAGSDIFASDEFKEWFEIWKERLSREERTEDDCKALMEKNNPRIIPRNHRVEEALEAAVENNDYSIMEALVNALKNPYDYTVTEEYYTKLPEPTSCPYKTYCGT
ncbi:MAG: YdiU family protein, partial [Clostridiaceae bacterium]|nr:YdiU family protein [Clostridiaceae bacterium]